MPTNPAHGTAALAHASVKGSRLRLESVGYGPCLDSQRASYSRPHCGTRSGTSPAMCAHARGVIRTRSAMGGLDSPNMAPGRVLAQSLPVRTTLRLIPAERTNYERGLAPGPAPAGGRLRQRLCRAARVTPPVRHAGRYASHHIRRDPLSARSTGGPGSLAPPASVGSPPNRATRAGLAPPILGTRRAWTARPARVVIVAGADCGAHGLRWADAWP
jgi:hypothetical protein